MTTPAPIRVGFVGLGVMGKAMARNILRAGFPLMVHNRSRAKVEELVAEGGKRALRQPMSQERPLSMSGHLAPARPSKPATNW